MRRGPLLDLCADYHKRIKPYHNLEILEVKDENIVSNDSEEAIKQRESARALKLIRDDEYVILLDLEGKEYDSPAFAKYLDNTLAKYAKICFVIAGSLGPSSELKARANLKWKLSSLTFLHQMCRLLVLEQIYRSFKILNNETYHK